MTNRFQCCFNVAFKFNLRRYSSGKKLPVSGGGSGAATPTVDHDSLPADPVTRRRQLEAMLGQKFDPDLFSSGSSGGGGGRGGGGGGGQVGSSGGTL